MQRVKLLQEANPGGDEGVGVGWGGDRNCNHSTLYVNYCKQSTGMDTYKHYVYYIASKRQ